MLKRLFGSGRPVLRPPGAASESEFDRLCIRCGQCAQVCPYQSIRLGHAGDDAEIGTPYLVARDVPCWVCMKCPPVCPSGALDPSVTTKEQVRMGRAVIDTDLCLPYRGVLCLTCYEACPMYREAITLPDRMRPVVDEEACIGCGICEHVCVAEVAAITVRP